MRACRPARVALFGAPWTAGHRDRSSSHTSSAFWACSRFSASSHTALAGPSITSSVISSPRCAGRQCSTMASGSASAQQSRVDLERPERLDPVQPVVLLAHRRPGVGDQDVGARCGRLGVGGHRHRGAGGLGALLGRGQHRRVGREAVRSGDGDVDAGGHPAEHQRVRHVVGAVTEIGQLEAGQRPLAFGDGLQIGQHLAGMELVGERVDHRHRRGRRHRRSRSWPNVRQTMAST